MSAAPGKGDGASPFPRHPEIQTSHGPMTPESLVDFLTYANYRHNRDISPHVTPEQWARIYPGADALEARYQADLAIRKANAQAVADDLLGGEAA